MNNQQSSIGRYVVTNKLKRSSVRSKVSNEQISEQLLQTLEQNQYLQHIECLLQQQIQLQLVNTNLQQHSSNSSNILQQIFGSQLKQYISQLKIEKLKLLRYRQEEVYGQMIDNSIRKIVEMNEKIDKIKEFYLYCMCLKNQSSQLAGSIEKYFEYARKEPAIVQQFQNYLHNPIVSDIIFKEYLKTYNVNIFTADLIVHYSELNFKGLLNQTETRIFQAERIPELCILQKNNVVFKQLHQINQKYSDLLDDMKHSYLNNLIAIVSRHQENQDTSPDDIDIDKNKKNQKFQEYNSSINQKLENLNYLIGKMSIMGNNLLQNIENAQMPVLVNQYEENFNSLTRYLRFTDQRMVNKGQLHHDYKKFLCSIFQPDSNKSQKQSLTQFFEKNLIFLSQRSPYSVEEQNQAQYNQQKFEFLQEKIIKTESLIVLNKIFSAFNMFSYIFEQINPGSVNEADYTFGSLKGYVDGEFRGELIKKMVMEKDENGEGKSGDGSKKCLKGLKGLSHSPSHKTHFNIFIETDEFGNWLLLNGTQKLIYPSAIYSLTQLLHYMLQVATLLQTKSLYSKQMMLQILSLKAEQITKIGEVIYNIYNLIKSKQVNCYELLNEYMKVMLKGFFEAEIRWLQTIDLTKEEYDIFLNQLDQIENQRIASLRDGEQGDIQKEYLQEKKRIQNEMDQLRVTKFLTFLAQKAKKADFLSQIIYELDSNYEISPVLKQLLRCEQFHNKTFYFQDNPQFYETVLYEIIQMRNNIKLDHYFTLPRLHEAFGFFTVKALSFGDILNQLAQLSTKQIKVTELLMFFRTQLKLKQAVFRGELYWLSYKGASQNGKQKTFKQFVEQQGKDILELSEEPLEYFLTNINDFMKKATLFEEEIEKFKHYQTIVGKMSSSKMKVKNIEHYLNGLTCKELCQLTKALCYYNPIQRILQNQNPAELLFSDMKASIQINNRIRFQDMKSRILMFEEKQLLAEQLFTMKCFSFELSYSDCFNIFIEQNKKSYNTKTEGLKLSIQREKPVILKHYEEMIAEDRKNVVLGVLFYKSLILVALVNVRSQTNDDDERESIEELLKHLSTSMDIMEEIQRIKQIFVPNKQSDHQSQELQKLLKIKSCLKRLQLYTSSLESNVFIATSPLFMNHTRETLCLMAKMSPYVQKKIVQKLQQIQRDIIDKEKNDSNKLLKELHCLNDKIVAYFLGLMTKYQSENTMNYDSLKEIDEKGQSEKTNSKDTIVFNDIQSAIKQVEEIFLIKIINLTQLKSQTFQNKEDLNLFDAHCGYKVKQDSSQNYNTNTRSNQLMRRNDRKIVKKGIFSPVRSAKTAHSNIMQNIQKRVGIEMIKESMGLRKVISKLELEEKKMKDQIAWETSKLQHNVINKIHGFITQSNMDQEQSYINFKYTVNLQTIKGMQNVIKEQTQLAIKASQETMKKEYKQVEKVKNSLVSPKKQAQESNFFLTNPNDAEKDSEQDEQSRLGYQNSHMLNNNIQSIFNHMKKIKIFAAWKKVNRNMDFTNQEWKKFNKNVANILHNEENIRKIEQINQKRSECFKENILCSLLKEENSILSEKIRNAKVESLNKIVQDYKRKLIGEEMDQ